MPQTFEAPPRIDANRPNNPAAQRAAEEAMGLAPDRAATNVRVIKREFIEPNHNNSRETLTAEQLTDMRHSLMMNGQQTPITVRPHPTIEDKWQVVIGDTRFRASEAGHHFGIEWIGLEELECKIVEADDAGAFLMSVVENRDRNQLTVLDECRAIRRLKEQYGYTKEAIMEVFGENRGWVDNRVAAAKVDPYWHPLLSEEGTMTKVIEANKVKDTKQRTALYIMIARGDSFEVVDAKVREILGTPPRAPRHAPVRPQGAPIQPRQGSVPQSNYEPFRGNGTGNGTTTTTTRSEPLMQRSLEFNPHAPAPEVLMTPEQFENRLDMEINYLSAAPKLVKDVSDAYSISHDARLRLRDKLLKIATLATEAAKKIDQQ